MAETTAGHDDLHFVFGDKAGAWNIILIGFHAKISADFQCR